MSSCDRLGVGRGPAWVPRCLPVVGLVALLCCLLGAAGASATQLYTRIAGSPFPSGREPLTVAFSPNGSLLAVPNSRDDTLDLFTVNGITHSLVRVTGSPFASAGGYPASVAFSPAGLLANTSAGAGNVAVFSLDPVTHAPTPVPGSPFATGTDPLSVTFSPSGGLLATADSADNTVSLFSVNPSTHSLSPVAGSPFPTGTGGSGPNSVAFSSNGSLLATANTEGNTVSLFSVDPITHRLTRVGGSNYGTGPFPLSVAFSPDGALLVIANGDAANISVFSIDPSTHRLTQVTGSPVPTDGQPNAVGFSPNGKLLAVAASAPTEGVVNLFSVDPVTHKLTLAAGSPYRTGSQPNSVVFSPNGVLFATADRYANTVSVFATPACQDVSAKATGGHVSTVLLDCADATGASLTYSIVSAPAHGSLGPINQSTRQVSYKAASTFSGTDVFTYRATSGNGTTATHTVLIKVLPDNDFTVSHVKAQKRGRIAMWVKVPGPGRVSVLMRARKGPHQIKFAVLRTNARRATTLHLLLKPVSKKKLTYILAHHLAVTPTITYTPTGGTAHTVTTKRMHPRS